MSKGNGFLDLLHRLVNWFVRRRHPSRIILWAGAAIMAATLGAGWTFGVSGKGGALNIRGWFSTGSEVPPSMIWTAFAIAVILLAVGATLVVGDWIANALRARRTAVIVHELRGLINTSDKPLLEAVPRRFNGQKLDGLVDVRTEMSSGGVQQAFDKISGVADLVRRLRGAREARNVHLLVGGVLQVPFLFYVGVLLDDEGDLTAMDWDRQGRRWRELDGMDDGGRFLPVDWSVISPGAARVVLAISASYQADFGAIEATFSGIPVISLALAHPLPDTLWSVAKQDALSAQFLGVMAELGNRGVKEVELVLAASSSLSIRLGRAYDRRNLPRVACYQYQRDASPPYPWCVEIEPSSARLSRTPVAASTRT